MSMTSMTSMTSAMREMVTRLARAARRCPSEWKLTRAVSQRPDPTIEWHLSKCERCSSDYRALLALAVTTDAAFPPPDRMSRDRRETIAAHLRVGVGVPETGSPCRRWASLWVMAPIALLVVATAWLSVKRALVSRNAPQGPTEALTGSGASIRAIGRARFARAELPPNEIVHLDEGSIELEVAPLHAGERFRVVTGDGEVEVRGTHFKVSAADHRLLAVHVWRGRVEVRSSGGAFAVLDAGDDWVRGTAAAKSGPPGNSAPGGQVEIPDGGGVTATRNTNAGGGGPAVTPAPRRLPRPRAPRALGQAGDLSSRDGASFRHAWSLLRQGDAKKAAAELAELERGAGGRPIEEDALYWRAFATARAGDPAGARILFGEFVRRFPGSPRAAEAAVALGWLLLDAGDTRAARQAFERAASDPSPHVPPQVRGDAQEGLRRSQEEDQDQ